MKKIFIYDNDILNAQLLVCVGVSAKEIKKWADKNSKNLKEIYKRKENVESTENAIKDNDGFVQYFTKDDKKFYLLWLKDFGNQWPYCEILLHEIVHFKQYQFANRNINNELEFESYFIESVFRELRRKILWK
ncbi:MAG: hypothetical protein WC269_01455 [Candidatus Gracilibacteria bacterium]